MPGVRSKTPNLNPIQRSGTNTPSTQNWTIPNAALPSMKTVANANDNGASKYTLAVEMAKDKFKDDPDVNQTIFKNAVDEIYNGMKSNTDKSAHDLRGENTLTDLGHLVGGGFNTLNNWIGTGLDSAIDTVGGGVLDFIGELPKYFGGEGQQGGGNWLRNLWSGEDLAVIPDMAEDIIISKIPIAGIPLTVAKNAAQRTDEISEALTGRDAITQEKLNGWEQGGRLAEAALGLGLSAVPGAVKSGAGKMAGEADKDIGGFFNDLVKKASSKIEGKEAGKTAEKAVAEAGQETTEQAAKEASGEVAEKAAKETAEEAAEKTVPEVEPQLTADAAVAVEAAPKIETKAAEEAEKVVPKAEKTAEETIEEATKEAPKKEKSKFRQAVERIRNNRKDEMGGAGSYVLRTAGLAAPLAESMAAATAAYGMDPLSSFGAYFGNGGANFMPAMADAVLLTAGGRHLTNKALPQIPHMLNSERVRNMIKPNRKYAPARYYALADMPFQSARAAAVGNMANQELSAQLVPEPEMDYAEVLARLQGMQEDEQNG